MSDSLFDKLKNLSLYPMHMPGHKRNSDLLGNFLPYGIDITEITGFDDLHRASGVIDDIQRRLAAFYGAKKSFLLVNGSTCGIMAAVVALCSFGDKIIAARNCHRSVYKAIELYNLSPDWVTPPLDTQTGIFTSVSADRTHPRCKSCYHHHADIRGRCERYPKNSESMRKVRYTAYLRYSARSAFSAVLR